MLKVGLDPVDDLAVREGFGGPLLVHGGLPQRPVLIGHRGLGQVENRGLIRHKLHSFVHSIELNGVVQEEEIGLVVGMPFHLLKEHPLFRPIHSPEDLVIEPPELRLLQDPVGLAIESIIGLLTEYCG